MNEFPLFFQFIAIKIGRKVAESSDIILPRPKKLFSTTINKTADLCDMAKRGGDNEVL